MTDFTDLLARLRWLETGTTTTAADAIEALVAERDALRRDAERYWWLRRERYDDELPSVQSVSVGCIGVTLEGNDLDAAIDAAMAKEKRDE
jgi:hypothetical protein